MAARTVKIAVEGCAHGALDEIYESIAVLEKRGGIKVDLLICCGDFQAVRNEDDLLTLACPPKYRSMNSFYKYYAGLAVAPILTVYIGGNHETSSHHLELYVLETRHVVSLDLARAYFETIQNLIVSYVAL